jgi:hypothetical protein
MSKNDNFSDELDKFFDKYPHQYGYPIFQMLTGIGNIILFIFNYLKLVGQRMYSYKFFGNKVGNTILSNEVVITEELESTDDEKEEIESTDDKGKDGSTNDTIENESSGGNEEPDDGNDKSSGSTNDTIENESRGGNEEPDDGNDKSSGSTNDTIENESSGGNEEAIANSDDYNKDTIDSFEVIANKIQSFNDIKFNILSSGEVQAYIEQKKDN